MLGQLRVVDWVTVTQDFAGCIMWSTSVLFPRGSATASSEDEVAHSAHFWPSVPVLWPVLVIFVNIFKLKFWPCCQWFYLNGKILFLRGTILLCVLEYLDFEQKIWYTRKYPTFAQRTLNKIEITFNETFVWWKSMHQGFKMHFIQNLRLKAMESTR